MIKLFNTYWHFKKIHPNWFQLSQPASLWRGGAWPRPPRWPGRLPAPWPRPRLTCCSTPGRGWRRWTERRRWRGRSRWGRPSECWRCPETCSGSSPVTIKKNTLGWKTTSCLWCFLRWFTVRAESNWDTTDVLAFTLLRNRSNNLCSSPVLLWRRWAWAAGSRWED